MRPTGSADDSAVRLPEKPTVPRGPREHAAVSGARVVRTERRSVLGRLARGLTGLLAGGLLVLAAVLLAAQLWMVSTGQEGPGVPAVVAHGLAAGVALWLQRLADHRRGAGGGWAALAVALVVLGSLWFWWWQ